MRQVGRCAVGFVLTLAIVIVGCGPAEGAGSSSGEKPAPSRTKSITIPVLNTVPGFSLGFGGTSPTGGWKGLSEIHSNGLLTTESTTPQRIGLLAEKAPSLDDGSVSLLPDGRMKVVWPLRKGVTWQDGVPFTAQDLVFSTRLLRDPGLPTNIANEIPKNIESTETPDDFTFVMYFKTQYFLAISPGLTHFWPLPEHILGPVHEKFRANGNAAEFLNHPYWTSEYVHLGPFRVTSFEPDGTISFQAYDGYFRGRPKLDVIRVQIFLNPNALFASVLAGQIDLFLNNTVEGDKAQELSDRWRASGEGRMYFVPDSPRVIVPQYRPAYQMEPAILDPRARIALSHALNREELAEVFSGSPDAAAYTAEVPSEPFYDAVKDIFRAYGYDPARARTILRDMGWNPGPDGILRNASDGRPFRTAISTTPGSERLLGAVAGQWRAIGLEVDEILIPPAFTSDREYRATYPGWETTTGTYMTRLRVPNASAENRWIGGRSGYDDPRLTALFDTMENTLSEHEQLQTMKAIGAYVALQVPLLPVAYNVDTPGARKGVKALDDVKGTFSPTGILGSYSRNAHLWDVE